MLSFLMTLEDESDKEKCTQLYERYRDLMFALAKRILNNEMDAEDAIHDAFITILDNLEKIEDIRSRETRAYVVLVAESRAIDLLRAGRRVEKMDPAKMDDLLEPMPPAAGRQSLKDCILLLPPAYREAIFLHYAMGYKLEEIAELVGSTEGAVGQRLSRARKKLFEICEEEHLI